MSLIEQATKRLEELSRAGVAVPWAQTGMSPAPAGAVPEAAAEPRPGPATAPPAFDRVRVVHGGPRTTAADASEEQGAGPLLELDLARLEAAGMVVPKLDHSTLGEEFRHLKRALLSNVGRPPATAAASPALIMVTSAVPGEGKTFCALNLALSMALEVDLSVLLVDADVLRPSILSRLGITGARQGLLDALSEPGLDVSALVLPTSVPKLSILPAGTPDHRSSERVASLAMDQLIETLAAAHPRRIIIFDGPPLLPSSAAGTLAAKMGQILMVVEASRTPRRLVAQAFAAVEQCPIVMSVLNKSSAGFGGYGYDGYGSYYS